jgi:hypothetical protein
MQAWKEKVYSRNISNPSLHFSLGKLEFIIKNNKNTRKCKQGRREKKSKNHQIFNAKIVTNSSMPIGL